MINKFSGTAFQLPFDKQCHIIIVYINACTKDSHTVFPFE